MADVNFDDVWKVVSSSDFVNKEPENEYDLKVVMRHYKLIRMGLIC